MLRTITIGSTLQVQGVPVGHTSDGKLIVRDGDRMFAGQPVPRWSEAATRMQRILSKAMDAPVLDAS